MRFKWYHLGFGVYWASNLLSFQSSVFFGASENSTRYVTLLLLTSIIVTVLAHFLIGISALLQPKRFTSPKYLPLALASTIGILNAGLAGFLPQGSAEMLIIGAGVLTGVGNAWLMSSWASVYGGILPRLTIFYIPLMCIVSILLYFFITFLSQLTFIGALLTAALLPVVSALMLKPSTKGGQPAQLPVKNTMQYRYAVASLWRVVFGACAFALILGLLWQLVTLSSVSLNTVHGSSLSISLIGLVILLALVYTTRTRFDADSIYRSAGFLIVLGFLLIPFVWDANPIFANTTVMTGFYLFDAVLWYLIVQTAYDTRVSGYIINGFARGLSIGSMALGMFMGYLLFSMGVIDIQLLAVILGCIYLIALVVFFIRSRKGKSELDRLILSEQQELPLRETPGSADREKVVLSQQTGTRSTGQDALSDGPLDDPFTKRLAAISDRYLLSSREREVFDYIARGRSAKYISEQLYVSEHTVRTHIRHIYSKLVIGSRQEMFDFIEDTKK